jgi:hypothetical protein
MLRKSAVHAFIFSRRLTLLQFSVPGIWAFDRRAADASQLKIAVYVLCNLDVYYVAR